MVRFITGRMQEEKIKKQPPETAAYHSKGTRYRAFTTVRNYVNCILLSTEYYLTVIKNSDRKMMPSGRNYLNILFITLVFLLHSVPAYAFVSPTKTYKPVILALACGIVMISCFSIRIILSVQRN